MSLQRNGLNSGSWTSNGYTAATYGLIDNLIYTYNAQNQLLIVKDASLLAKGFKSVNNPNSTQYTYDANGNLKTDLNKGITNIDYNFLNLPQIITFTGGRSIQFIYDASGAKLRKIVNNNGATETTDYVNGIEYKNNTLQRVAHTEGAIIRNENYAYQHEFVLRDHLGNARVSFRDGTNLGEATWRYSSSAGYMVYMDPNEGNTSYNDGIVTASDIRQINNYYPFGLNMEGNWNGAEGTNKYQYNEKEWNDDFSLGWNDYGARFYDPAVARWVAVDPKSGKYNNVSPYNYVENNPLTRIDPNGKEWVNPYRKELNRNKDLTEAQKKEYTANAELVDKLLSKLKTENSQLYDYVDNLKIEDSNGKEKNVPVNVYLGSSESSKDKGEVGVTITTSIESSPKAKYKGKEIAAPMTTRPSGANGKEIASVRSLGFNIIVYDNSTSTLANESGDVMYYMENNDKVKDNYGKPYMENHSTIYSFLVEESHNQVVSGSLKDSNIYPLIYDSAQKSATTPTGTNIKIKN